MINGFFLLAPILAIFAPLIAIASSVPPAGLLIPFLLARQVTAR